MKKILTHLFNHSDPDQLNIIIQSDKIFHHFDNDFKNSSEDLVLHRWKIQNDQGQHQDQHAHDDQGQAELRNSISNLKMTSEAVKSLPEYVEGVKLLENREYFKGKEKFVNLLKIATGQDSKQLTKILENKILLSDILIHSDDTWQNGTSPNLSYPHGAGSQSNLQNLIKRCNLFLKSSLIDYKASFNLQKNFFNLNLYKRILAFLVDQKSLDDLGFLVSTLSASGMGMSGGQLGRGCEGFDR